MAARASGVLAIASPGGSDTKLGAPAAIEEDRPKRSVTTRDHAKVVGRTGL